MQENRRQQKEDRETERSRITTSQTGRSERSRTSIDKHKETHKPPVDDQPTQRRNVKRMETKQREQREKHGTTQRKGRDKGKREKHGTKYKRERISAVSFIEKTQKKERQTKQRSERASVEINQSFFVEKTQTKKDKQNEEKTQKKKEQPKRASNRNQSTNLP